jgi:hypothetical protein
MVDAFMTLFVEAAFSFLPILAVYHYLRWTKLLSNGRYSASLCAFAFGMVCYIFPYMLILKSLSAVLGEFEVNTTFQWVPVMAAGGMLHYLLQRAVVKVFFTVPARSEKEFSENLPLYLFSLALGGYSVEFLDDVEHFVRSLVNLIEFTVERSDPFGAMASVELSVLSSLLLSAASCLWLVFLTLTAFSISEEVGDAGKRRYLGMALFSAMAAVDIGLLLYSLEEFSVVSLALGNLLMLHYYRRLKAAAGGSARRP